MPEAGEDGEAAFEECTVFAHREEAQDVQAGFKPLPWSDDERRGRHAMAERLKRGELLIMGGAIDQTQLGAALAHQRLALTEEKGAKTLHLAVLDPGNIEALDLIGFQVGHKVSPVLAAPTELEKAVQRRYAQGGGRGTGGSRQLAPCRERYERDPVRADCQVDPAARPPQAAPVVSPAVEVPLGTSASGEGP